MKTQANLIRPPTLDATIAKYLMKDVIGNPTFPENVYAIGRYRKGGGCGILVYKQEEELVFDLGHLQHGSIPIELRNTSGSLEKYLHRTEHLSYGDHIVLKYTKYWD